MRLTVFWMGADIEAHTVLSSSRFPNRLCAGGKPLLIVAVLHTRRNPRVLAAILRHRK
jgi:hypothetical protein